MKIKCVLFLVSPVISDEDQGLPYKLGLQKSSLEMGVLMLVNLTNKKRRMGEINLKAQQIVKFNLWFYSRCITGKKKSQGLLTVCKCNQFYLFVIEFSSLLHSGRNLAQFFPSYVYVFR